ncbi:MAG: hypothetical protein ACRENA_11110, partial [Vulcanimicrobiaceae bacterium]
GYDFAAGDPVGDLGVDVAASSAIATYVREIAEEFCEGRVVFVLEGGYDLGLLAEGVEQTIRSYDSGQSEIGVPSNSAIPAPQREALDRALW